MSWQDYQEEAAEFFRSLGLDATVNARVQGTRTHHDIDVLVRSRHAGFEVTWLVECKQWQSRVSKLHVLGLRQIVVDAGADRGILLSEAGFQSGAIEAATLTNVQVTSLAEARNRCEHDIFAMRMLDLFDRVTACKARYWDLSKDVRIRFGLRPDYQDGYSGARVISAAEELLGKGLRGRYPFEVEFMTQASEGIPESIANAGQVVEILAPKIAELERRLDAVPPNVAEPTAGAGEA